jgi:hypothetical protein
VVLVVLFDWTKKVFLVCVSTVTNQWPDNNFFLKASKKEPPNPPRQHAPMLLLGLEQGVLLRNTPRNPQ